jgi:hypothetical protein
MAYNHGGTPVITTTNTEKMGRTAREMAEAQRDAYEALSENLAAAQRRSIGLANDGLKFVRLQEDNAKAAREFFANGVKLLQHQQRNAEFVGSWTSDAVEALREQTEHNVRTAEAFARSASKQQEVWVGTYRTFFSPFSYASYAREGMRTFRRATQQGLEATQQIAQQGLEVAEEATEQTEEVLRRTEEATRQAEIRIAVFGALKTADYDGLTVDEIANKLDGLTRQQLEQVLEYEKQNKNRETLIEQVDRKIRVKNS